MYLSWLSVVSKTNARSLQELFSTDTVIDRGKVKLNSFRPPLFRLRWPPIFLGSLGGILCDSVWYGKGESQGNGKLGWSQVERYSSIWQREIELPPLSVTQWPHKYRTRQSWTPETNVCLRKVYELHRRYARLFLLWHPWRLAWKKAVGTCVISWINWCDRYK